MASSPPSAKALNVLVVGAGVCGPIFALILQRSNPNHNITVVERWPSLRTGGQQIDLKAQCIDIGARWSTFTQKSYDLVHTKDHTGSSGRLHHIAFATDTREDVLRAADLAVDTGVFIETGPHKHAIQQTFFLYVYEPGGNRVELCNPLTRLVLAPDWPLITWTERERAKGQAWGLQTIESFHTHGTPPVD